MQSENYLWSETAEEPSVAHGGALDEARRRHPSAPEPWIDLSTGINPVPYPLPAIPADAWTRLPFRSEERALRQAAALRYGAPHADAIVAAPGTQALIQIVPRLMRRGRVAILGPTYAEHAAAWAHQGHQVFEAASLHEAADADAAVVVSPNNPTGRTFALTDLQHLAHELAARDGLLIVDEAFIDVALRSQPLTPALPQRTIVLRSFGKTYGLAGLRLGFAVSEMALARQLRALLGPWPVSGPAIAIGTHALADDTWIKAAGRRLSRDADRLDALLVRTGFEIVGGTPLFRLASHPDATARAETLAAHGILVRSFAYARDWLRFGLPGDDAVWRRLASALATI